MAVFSLNSCFDLVHDLHDVLAIHVLLTRLLEMWLESDESASLPVDQRTVYVEGEEFKVCKFGHDGGCLRILTKMMYL